MLRMFSARTAPLAEARIPCATATRISSGATGCLAVAIRLPIVMEPSTKSLWHAPIASDSARSVGPVGSLTASALLASCSSAC
jgi:hypothetical protein